ncbi:MAG: hypothetical protein V1736_05455 [Pseudomonadota bacterium]
MEGKTSLCIFPQILSEFYAIITDSKRISNPRNQEEAVAEIEKYLKAKHLLKFYPESDVVDIMLDLLRRYDIRKQEIFDTQLVAAMLSNNITRIYTFNRNHFSKFSEIEVLEP